MGSAVIEGELWGARAEEWTSLAEPCTKPLWQAMIDRCGVVAGTNLLDLGCGGGGLSVLAAERGAKVSGFDASANLLEVACRRVPSGSFRQGDLEDLPYGDNSFDVVIASNSIQYAENQGRAVAEANRVLRPGGRFGIGMWCEPERCEMRAVLGAVMQFAPPPTGNEPPTLSLRENLVSLVESGGFEILEEAEVECPFEYASPDDAWDAFRSAGIIIMVTREAGEDTVGRAVIEALEPHRRADGSLRLSNWFRYLICA